MERKKLHGMNNTIFVVASKIPHQYESVSFLSNELK